MELKTTTEKENTCFWNFKSKVRNRDQRIFVSIPPPLSWPQQHRAVNNRCTRSPPHRRPLCPRSHRRMRYLVTTPGDISLQAHITPHLTTFEGVLGGWVVSVTIVETKGFEYVIQLFLQQTVVNCFDCWTNLGHLLASRIGLNQI